MTEFTAKLTDSQLTQCARILHGNLGENNVMLRKITKKLQVLSGSDILHTKPLEFHLQLIYERSKIADPEEFITWFNLEISFNL